MAYYKAFAPREQDGLCEAEHLQALGVPVTLPALSAVGQIMWDLYVSWGASQIQPSCGWQKKLIQRLGLQLDQIKGVTYG